MAAMEITIRDATLDDAETIAEFNCRLASETEDKPLDAETVRAGVKALLSDARHGRYFVACDFMDAWDARVSPPVALCRFPAANQLFNWQC